jgi:hypothetical protein
MPGNVESWERNHIPSSEQRAQAQVLHTHFLPIAAASSGSSTHFV